MLMSHITDPVAFVKTLPKGYSSGNPTNRPAQKILAPLWTACAITGLLVFFTICILSFG